MANARAMPYEKLRLPELTGDYTYLMERLPDQTTGVSKVGPDQIRYGGFARRVPAGGSMHLKADDRFLQSLKGSCRLLIVYYDEQPETSFTVALGGHTWKVPLRGGNLWQTAQWNVAATDLALPTRMAGLSFRTRALRSVCTWWRSNACSSSSRPR